MKKKFKVKEVKRIKPERAEIREIEANREPESREKGASKGITYTSKVKTLKGLYQKFSKEAKNTPEKTYTAKELEKMLQEVTKRLKTAEVKLNKRQGKSGIKVIEKPDSFDIIVYRKGKPVKKNVSREEVNKVIKAINNIDKEKGIKTRWIAENYCRVKGIRVNSHGKELFDENDRFDFDVFFADRSRHNLLNLILRMLDDEYGLIKYENGYTQIISKVTEIQEVL